MKRRERIAKPLKKITKISVLEPVKEIKLLRVGKGDIVVLRVPREDIKPEWIKRLNDEWNARFPDIKCMVLGDGIDIEVIKNLK